MKKHTNIQKYIFYVFVKIRKFVKKMVVYKSIWINSKYISNFASLEINIANFENSRIFAKIRYVVIN